MVTIEDVKVVIAAEAAQYAEKIAEIQATIDDLKAQLEAALADDAEKIAAAVAAALAEQSAALGELVVQIKGIVPDEDEVPTPTPEEPPVEDGEVVTELQ